MSLSIGPAMMALHIASCGCSGCAPMPVMRAVAEPVTPSRDVSGEDAAAKDAAATDGSSAVVVRLSDKAAPRGPGTRELSDDEQRMVTELQSRDREVRTHEAAHQAAGGGYVGAASFSYQQGPDGRQYAIGGEVPVDLSVSGKDPSAVIAKMARVRAAALAPASPSAQDMAVAAAASAMEGKARLAQLEQSRATAAEPSTAARGPAESLDPADTRSEGPPPVPASTVGRALGAYRAVQSEPDGSSRSQRV